MASLQGSAGRRNPGRPALAWLVVIWAAVVTVFWVAKYHEGPAVWADGFRRFFLQRPWSGGALLLNWAVLLSAVAALPGLLAVLRSSGEAAWRWLGQSRRTRRGSGPRTAGGSRLLEAHILGFGLAGSAVLGAGLCGLLVAPPAPWSVLGLAAWGLADITRRPRAWGWWAEAGASMREAARGVSAPVRWCLGLAALVTAAHVFGIETGWDAMTYHLRVPEMYGIRHKVFDVWHYPTGMFPALAEMLFTGARLAAGDMLVRLLTAATALLVLAATRRVAHELGVPGGWPVAVVVASPLFLLLATRAYVDLYVVLFAAGGWMGWLEWRRAGSSRAAAFSGLCTGCAMACKYSAVLLAVAVVVAAAGDFGSRRRSRGVGWWLGLAVLPVLPWLARSWDLRGNPVYPLLSGLWGMPAARSADVTLPFEGVPPEGGVLPRSLTERALALFFHDGHFDGPLAPAVAALLPLLLVTRFPAGSASGLRRGLVAFLLGWIVLCPDLRFMAPVIVPLCVLASVALRGLAARGRPAAALRVVLEAGLACAALYAAGYQWRTDAPFAMPLGFETREDKLELGLRPAPFFAYTARAVQAVVPADGRILAVCLVHTYYLEREALADVHYGTAHVTRIVAEGRTEAGIARRVRQLGIGWVLASGSVCAEYAHVPGYFDAPATAWAAWRGFLATRAEAVRQTDGLVLYRIGRSHAPRFLPSAPPLDVLACLSARRALDRGDARSALALLRSVPAWLDATGTPWMLRAKAHLVLRDADAAIPAYAEAARRGVDDPELHLGLARALYATGRGGDAALHVARAFAMHPRSAYASALMAILLAERGRLDDARRLARRAAALDPAEPAYPRLLRDLGIP
ncbi:MAG: hypothetical protein AAB152_08255 [Candidatus Coatesbacteria bacterium]